MLCTKWLNALHMAKSKVMCVADWDWLVQQFVASGIKKKLSHCIVCMTITRVLKTVLWTNHMLANFQYKHHSSHCPMLYNVHILHAFRLILKIMYCILYCCTLILDTLLHTIISCCSWNIHMVVTLSLM